MAKGFKAIKRVKQKGVSGLAWASFVIAVVGGALAAGMWIGDVIETVLKAIPIGWVPEVLLFAALVTIGLDLFLDGVPNWMAIVGAILTPSIATATFGKLGDKVGEWSAALLGWLGGPMEEWVGTDSATGLAIAAIIGSLLMARRVVRKSAGITAGA